MWFVRRHGPVRFLSFSRKTENAWLAFDRRERLKFLAASIALFGAALAGIAWLVYALAHG